MTNDPVAPPAARPDPTRNLWQVPVLLLGVGMFVSVWQGWLFAGGPPGDNFALELALLKDRYERAAPDAAELKAQLNKVAANVDAYRDEAPQARFYLGSGYVRLAEITPALDESQGYWTLARQHFGLVSDKQFRDPADASKFTFRAAKARAAGGLPPDTSLADITQLVRAISAVPAGEEPGDAHRLIAELAMKANPPNYQGAKLELVEYLHKAGIATPPASLARARLRLSELYVFLKENEPARKCLEEIVGRDVPDDVIPYAKALLAKVLMAQDDLDGASKTWELLRGMSGVPPALRLTAVYQLAVCRLKERKFADAAALFDAAAKGTGPEAPAAAVQLADLRLRDPSPEQHKTAADLLAAAVKDTRKPDEYDPALVSLAEIQAVFERAVATLLADGAFEPAERVAKTYAAVSAPGRDGERRAEVLGTWGTALQKAKNSDAKAKFKEAADEFTKLAALEPSNEGKLNLLRRAASFYRQAGDPNTAVARIEEGLKLPGIKEELLLPTWAELADALLAANRTDEVWKVFNKIMAETTPLSTATRYRLARQFADSRHPGLMPLGRMLFEQIAKQQQVAAEEREFHERALTELANVLIREGNFAEAEAKLRTQLDTYPYPRAAESGLAKLLLGVCLLQRAAALTPTTPAEQTQVDRMRQEAAAGFKQIVADCDAAQKRNGRLTERETWLRLQAALRVLQAYQQMKKPDDLLAEADQFRAVYRNSVEELIIMSLMYHAFKQLNNNQGVVVMRDQMRELFDRLPPSAFTQTTGEYSREYWLKVWFPPESK